MKSQRRDPTGGWFHNMTSSISKTGSGESSKDIAGNPERNFLTKEEVKPGMGPWRQCVQAQGKIDYCPFLRMFELPQIYCA